MLEGSKKMLPPFPIEVEGEQFGSKLPLVGLFIFPLGVAHDPGENLIHELGCFDLDDSLKFENAG